MSDDIKSKSKRFKNAAIATLAGLSLLGIGTYFGIKSCNPKNPLQYSQSQNVPETNSQTNYPNVVNNIYCSQPCSQSSTCDPQVPSGSPGFQPGSETTPKGGVCNPNPCEVPEKYTNATIASSYNQVLGQPSLSYHEYLINRQTWNQGRADIVYNNESVNPNKIITLKYFPGHTGPSEGKELSNLFFVSQNPDNCNQYKEHNLGENINKWADILILYGYDNQNKLHQIASCYRGEYRSVSNISPGTPIPFNPNPTPIPMPIPEEVLEQPTPRVAKKDGYNLVLKVGPQGAENLNSLEDVFVDVDINEDYGTTKINSLNVNSTLYITLDDLGEFFSESPGVYLKSKEGNLLSIMDYFNVRTGYNRARGRSLPYIIKLTPNQRAASELEGATLIFKSNLVNKYSSMENETLEIKVGDSTTTIQPIPTPSPTPTPTPTPIPTPSPTTTLIPPTVKIIEYPTLTENQWNTKKFDVESEVTALRLGICKGSEECTPKRFIKEGEVIFERVPDGRFKGKMPDVPGRKDGSYIITQIHINNQWYSNDTNTSGVVEDSE